MPKAKAKTRGTPSPHNYLYPGTQILKNKYEETDLKLFLEKCSYDIEEATNLFNSLKNIHPFIDGNEYTEQFLFEKLAKAAEHQLDFSLITKERMLVSSVAAIQDNNLEPMHHLFEDISNPNKMLLLKEFMNDMKKSGRNVNDRPVMIAKEGETYTGTYRGAGFESFAFNVKDAYIIGQKEPLTPEQLKTLKPGDKFTFTVPKAKELEKVLIPKEQLAPLTKSELSEKVAEDARVHICRDQIQKYAKIVYGSSKALNEQMVEIIKNPSFGQHLANQIEKAPHSVSRLAGLDLLCFQNQARANAKEHVDVLCNAVANYTHAVKQAGKEITQEYQAEQKRCEKTVEMPSKNLQDILFLPKELQQEALASSPFLQKELRSFVKKINNRLSPSEQKALKECDHETLAKSLGVSEHKAKEITEIAKQTREVYQQSQVRTVNHSKTLAMAS
ncbi:BID domain-containing T4SS effector [Bartonella taylorii]|uniref:BID domain-containing T4SS effector n=1 Tax=Bartonella taylorii TaxID=33046 RepID=UPI001ABAC1CC|nr:BID domain-containing T4SS effector [Bartonella taylorii]